MPTPSIQTLRADAQQVLNLDSISAVRSVVAATLANANAGTPLNPNLTTQQLWNEFYQIVTQPKSDIESIIANQLMKFLYAPPAPGGAGADKQVIFNDGGVLAGDPQFLWNKTTNLLTVTGAATITGDLTVDTNVLKVNTTTNRVGINTTTPSQNLEITGSGNPLVADGCSAVRLNNTVSSRPAVVGVDDSQNFVIWNVGTEVSETIKFLTGGGNGKEQYRITHGGLFNWYDGAGNTRMTLDATGLLVGTTNNFGNSRLCVQGTAGTGTPDVTIGTPVNSGGNTNLAIGRSTATNGYIYLDAYKAAVGGTELALNSINGGTVLVGLSTVVAAGGCLQLKSGITFPATQVASSDANTLDDYEEGTWTATVNGATGNPATKISGTGAYTKIGRQVFVHAVITGDTTGYSGAIFLTGMPFVNSGTEKYGAATLGNADFQSRTSIASYIPASTSSIYFIGSATLIAAAYVLHSPGAAREIIFSATYTVA